MNKLLDRFFHYITFDTQSKINARKSPSTEGQLKLAKRLQQELNELGLSDVLIDDFGNLTATLASNVSWTTPVVAFISHLDTSPDLSGRNIKPQLIDNYRGGEIALGNGEEVLSPIMFPILRELIGYSLITTDGKTLLGCESKASIAEIMTALATLQQQQLPHGTIKIAFVSDLCIDKGSEYLDLHNLAADWAYTFDCSGIANVEYETFNAASAYIKIVGNNVHSGLAKDVMVNALSLAMKFQQALPANEVPEKTTGNEGFYHLHNFKGSVDMAEMHYLLRDFYSQGFKKRKQKMLAVAEQVGDGLHPDCYIEITINDTFYNSKEKLANYPYIRDLAEQAILEMDLQPNPTLVRGGGCAARLTYRGLPCLSLSNGGYNFQSKHEFASVQGMQASCEVIVKLAQLIALQAKTA